MNPPEQHAAKTGDNAGPTPAKGYQFASWLHPYTNLAELGPQSSNPDSPSSRVEQPVVPVPKQPAAEVRRRGRPRVSALRDETAIEKRRAQVRKAQRTYQQRKDSNTKAATQRHDEILKVLADISTDVEELLNVAAKAGMLDRSDEVGTQVRRLWDSYDAAIHRPCIMPELKPLQIQNDQRRVKHRRNDTYQITHPEQQLALPGLPTEAVSSGVELSLVRGGNTTVLQSFAETTSTSKIMGGRTIFDVVTERQARFRASNNSAA